MSSNSISSTPVEHQDARRCASCNYDLRGLELPRCPECGATFNPDAPPPAAVPWLSRREIGWWRAYWGTVLLVLFRPNRLGEEVRRAVEVPDGDGLCFRAATICVAVMSASVAGLLLALAEGSGWYSFDAVAGFAGTTVAATAFLAMATVGVNAAGAAFVGGSFHTDLRFRRLRSFGCAGLAAAPVVPAAVAYDLLASAGFGFEPMASPIAVLAVGLVWWAGEVAYQYFGGGVGAARAVAFAVMLPVLWLVFATGMVALAGLVIIMGQVFLRL